MLVVVVIIGILAGVLVPRLVGAKERASDSARLVKVWQLNTAVETYAQDNGGVYPIAPLTTTGTSIATPFVSSAIGSYLTTIPTDPGKGTLAILGASGNIMVTWDSFAYYTNTGWTMYAITALMESKKGNTTNAIGVIDSDKQGWYQVLGKGLAYSYALWGKAPVGITQNWTDLIISDGTNTYVIMDRNLWASIAGTWPASYGYFYQRGNNFGFWNGTTWTNQDWSATITTTWTRVNNAQPGYTSGTFVKRSMWPQDWLTTQNDNLRWDTTDTVIARKWPCPTWYHVPKKIEWQWLYLTWLSLNPWQGSNSDLFRDTLKLPKAGRYTNNAVMESQGFVGYYWQSSIGVNGGASYIEFAGTLIIRFNSQYRTYGFPIRCFKN